MPRACLDFDAWGDPVVKDSVDLGAFFCILRVIGGKAPLRGPIMEETLARSSRVGFFPNMARQPTPRSWA
jgi:hypothetical protein